MGKFVPVRSVKKALDVLDLVIEANVSGQCATLAALVGRMRMPRSSVHNLLKTLVACGYAELSSRGVYVPGNKCRQLLRLGRLDNPEIVEAIGQTLQRFTDEQHESCMLVILVNGERAVVCFIDCKRAVRLSHPTVESRTFFEKPTGRMLSAIADENELQQILDRQGLPGRLWNDINDEATLRAELAKLREQGYAYSRVTQPDEGYVTFACPVAAPGERPWSVVGTSVPAYRCPESREKELLKSLRELADRVAEVVPTYAMIEPIPTETR
ncbi:MAG TPA: IclR family transcriptional regulator C-terminal domain-containing protein [Phycisphaerae bacterium]|nr:helix-turn-helix domain-containing protein [Phycisphaerae bacterium]HOI54430.1 IclR family transcriptional regulator C-terminal domain-containing protein [Phycisphaerae bacterium]